MKKLDPRNWSADTIDRVGTLVMLVILGTMVAVGTALMQGDLC